MKLKLFITAFLQVLLVSANTYFIANKFWIGIAFAGFGISYFWSINVKKISISNMSDRLVYCSGATLGGLLGVFISSHLI